MWQVLWRQKCTKQHTNFLLSVWHDRWQQLIRWSSSEQMNFLGYIDISPCKPTIAWPRPILQDNSSNWQTQNSNMVVLFPSLLFFLGLVSIVRGYLDIYPPCKFQLELLAGPSLGTKANTRRGTKWSTSSSSGSSNVLPCKEYGMNPWKVSAWQCWPMRRTSLWHWPKRSRKVYMEERGIRRLALLLCVGHWDSQCLYPTPTPTCYMLDIQGMWIVYYPQIEENLCIWGGWVLPTQKLGCYQAVLQIWMING